jgi:aminoglycoside 6-adenylyltransferase
MNPRYAETVEKIADWCREAKDVHAAIVLGSQVRSEAPGDEWSDVDILLLVDDPTPYLQTNTWLDFLGERVCELVEETPLDWLKLTWSVRRLLFADNRALDFSILPYARIDDVLVLNAEIHRNGYRVIYAGDPGDVTARVEVSLAALKLEGPKIPTQAELEQVVNDLLFQLIWAGKKVKRGELWVAVSAINQLVSTRLLQLVEYYTATTPLANAPIRYEGRFLEQRIPAWLAEELPDCYARYDAFDAIRTIGHLIELIARLSAEICRANGYLSAPHKFEQVKALYLDLLE